MCTSDSTFDQGKYHQFGYKQLRTLAGRDSSELIATTEGRAAPVAPATLSCYHQDMSAGGFSFRPQVSFRTPRRHAVTPKLQYPFARVRAGECTESAIV